MIILGIETSCDETALAIVEADVSDRHTEVRVIDSLIHSQADLHSAYGGVYPSLAKREHSRNLIPLLHKLLGSRTEPVLNIKKELSKADFDVAVKEFEHILAGNNADLLSTIRDADFLRFIPSIDRIAVTEGPGLEPTLWVGINFARFLSHLWNIPIIAINHMEGHIVGSLLDELAWNKKTALKSLPLPAIALLISGGHTQLVEVSERQNELFSYKIIGDTLDDAVGEAFDKVARLLGLPYPGGPHLSMLARQAEEKNIKSEVVLPRPMLKSDDLNFSFSGLKTAVLYAIRKQGENISETWKQGLAREFEQAVSETLVAKVKKAIEAVSAKALIIGGGVSANRTLRKAFEDVSTEYNIPLFLPSSHISGDNALMIAIAGAVHDETGNNSLRAQGTKRLG